MCGIAGFVATPDVIDPHGVLDGMLSAIEHRGPDDDGRHVDGGVAIGMRRLAIIDLAGGRQPMADEAGASVVVFNGEVYDYRETARALRARGHVLRTESDTEVIPHLYEEHGDECVQHLRGMFAFAVWDARRQRLLLARDRLGIKPLYFTQVGRGIVFASEIKALLRHPAVRPALDPEGLGLYLGLKYVCAPRTMFAGVRSLPAGHVLTWQDGVVSIRAYWDATFADAPSDERASVAAATRGVDRDAAAVDELLDVLREAVSLHLRSDVPFGAFLSGGVDSSLIVALMSAELDAPVRTFALGFERTAGVASELPYARTVAEAFGTDHHEVVIGHEAFVDDAERAIWHMDQPIADQATVATYRLALEARRHVKMVLTGEGGDELFAGYARYAAERWSPAFGAIPTALRPSVWALAERLPSARLRRAKIALYALLQHEESARFASWFPLFNDAALERVLTPELRAATLPDGASGVFESHLRRVASRDPVQRMLYVDTKTWLPDFLLLRGDKLTMAASLEARVPLLDHEVVAFAASRPSSDKVRGGRGKHLLRAAARRLLPAAIVDRPKQGFPVPISDWFRGPARSFLHDLLADGTVRRRGLFEPVEVDRLLREHDRGLADHGPLLWGLASVELWQRVFLDRDRDTSRTERPARIGRSAGAPHDAADGWRTKEAQL